MKSGDLEGIYGCNIMYKGINYEVAYSIYETGKAYKKIVILLVGT